MRYSPTIARLRAVATDNGAVHRRAREMSAAGRDVIALAVGEPDVPAPDALIEAACSAMRAGRTGYSNGAGEPGLRAALATRYSAQIGREVGLDRILCFSGTQTTLFAAPSAVWGPPDDLLVGNPMYATYEAVVAATGARPVRVPLRVARGFWLDAGDLAACITDRTVAVLLDTSHNPTGAVLTRADIRAIGEVARAGISGSSATRSTTI